MTDDEDNQRAAADRAIAGGPAHVLVTLIRSVPDVCHSELQPPHAGRTPDTTACTSTVCDRPAPRFGRFPVISRHGATAACRTSASVPYLDGTHVISAPLAPHRALIKALPGPCDRRLPRHRRAPSDDSTNDPDGVPLSRNQATGSLGGSIAYSSSWRVPLTPACARQSSLKYRQPVSRIPVHPYGCDYGGAQC
jgi:hypothetical protein